MKLKHFLTGVLTLALILSCAVLPFGASAAEPVVSAAWDGTSSSAPSGGGTEDAPFLITNGAELRWLSDLGSSRVNTFSILTADIDLGGQQWKPGTFYGTLDGGNHKIFNFIIGNKEDPSKNPLEAGLFSRLDRATVKNLVIDQAEIASLAVDSGYAGAVAGYAQSAKVVHVTVGADVTVTGCNAGGMVGRSWNYGNIIAYCTNNGAVSTCGNTNIAQEAAGGMVGLGGGVTIQYCVNNGKITGGSTGERIAGGIAGIYGRNTAATVSNCLNTGEVSSTHTAGGIAGKNTFNDCTYDHCYSTVTVLSGLRDWSGNLVGRFNPETGSLTNCMAPAHATYGAIGANSANADHCTQTDVKICSTEEELAELNAAAQTVLDQIANYQDDSPIGGDDSGDPSDPGELGTPEGITGAVWDGSVAEFYDSGVGSAADPFVIRTAEQLAFFATAVNSGLDSGEGRIYVLADNIDLAGKEWTPIGTKDHPFRGCFNGKGFTIFNFTVTSKDDQTQIHAGVFGDVVNGIVRNLNVDWAIINVRGKASVAGGIVGSVQNSDVIACTVGEHTAVFVTDMGIGNNTYSGGIVGVTANNKGESTLIQYCINRAKVYAANTVSSVGAGGILGLSGGDTRISWCTNEGHVEAGNATDVSCIAGGIIANMGSGGSTSVVENCTNAGEIKSLHTAGGIVGRLNVAGNLITNSYSTGSVYGNLDYTGLGVGRCENNATLTGCGYLASSMGDIPNNVGVWYAVEAIGKRNPGLVDSKSPNTLNQLEEAEMETLVDAQAKAIEQGIADSILKADEDMPTPPPYTPGDVTTSGDDVETQAPPVNTDATTGGETGTAGNENSGCQSTVAGVGAILFLAAVAVVAMRKKERNAD